MDLVLNNLQRLICHKTQQTKPEVDLRNLMVVKIQILKNYEKKKKMNEWECIIAYFLLIMIFCNQFYWKFIVVIFQFLFAPRVGRQ